MSRTPLTTLEELDALDTDEVIEGYRDGRSNEPCGDNRSLSFWHGWRNGQVDGGHKPKDAAQAAIARAYVEATNGRKTLQ